MACIGTPLPLEFSTQKEKEGHEYFKINKSGALPSASVFV
jgi:hypothetical protein